MTEVGVASVPGSSFYRGDGGRQQLRFCFCKQDATLMVITDVVYGLAALALLGSGIPSRADVRGSSPTPS